MTLSLRAQLLLLVGVPLAALALLATLDLAARHRERVEMDRVASLSRLAVGASQLIHELQRERGRSALFLGSGGKDGGGDLPAQQRSTDEAATAFRALADSLELDEELRGAVARVDGLHGELETLRGAVREQRLGHAEASREYTRLLGIPVSLQEGLASRSNDAAISRLLLAYVNLVQIGEWSGRERAMLSGIFRAGSFPDVSAYAAFAAAPASQEAFRQAFLRLATPDERTALGVALGSPEAQEAEALRRIALDGADGRPLAVDGSRWFAAATARIDKIAEVEKSVAAELQSFAAARASAARRAFLVRSIALGAGILAIAALGWFFALRLARTLRRVVARVDALRTGVIAALGTAGESMARGELTSCEVPALEPLGLTGGDELGVLARAVDAIVAQSRGTAASIDRAMETVRHLIDESARLIAAAEAGKLDVRGHAADLEGAYRALIDGTNHLLDTVVKPVAEAGAVLEQVASRDLTARMHGAYEGDHGRIQRALHTAVENLDRALSEVQGSSRQLAAAAEQIASGSQDLAQGASMQAESLDGVSSELRELASSARQTAAGTGEVRRLAGEARQEVVAGEERMQRLSEAIAKISASAADTARIVRSIDEIAFQTNLLALNAAVEAARAGDAGRGFAVVAEEVRSLAQRAAAAARQTTALLEESSANASTGAALHREVLESFHAITGRVARVSEVAAEIAEGSASEANAVARITEGAGRISEATQRVAANAEESASTAEELSSQAAELSALVDGFHLTAAAARAAA